MKEKELIDLGFKKVIVPVEESGDFEFYYFVYDFSDSLSLISNADNERIDGEFEIEFFNKDEFSFNNVDDIKILIDVINRNKK